MLVTWKRDPRFLWDATWKDRAEIIIEDIRHSNYALVSDDANGNAVMIETQDDLFANILLEAGFVSFRK